MNAPLLPNEDERLDALRQYQILDTPPEQEFEDLTYLAKYICGTSMAAVVLVDEDRQWFKAKVGFSGEETPRELSFCAHTILENDLLVVPDATTNPTFADHPQVLADPNLRFYAGMPLTTPQGHNIGTLCVVDTKPHQLTPEQKDALRRLGRQVMAQLEARPSAFLREKSDEKPSRQSRLQSENSLRESEARYRRLFESTQDGILILDAASGQIEDVNPHLSRLLGYPAEYFLGKAFWEIDIFQAIAANPAALHTLQQEEYIRHEDLLLKTQNGQAVSVELVSSVYAVGTKKVIQCNIRDLSARKSAEQALSESEARFRFLTDLGDRTRALSEPAKIMEAIASQLGLHMKVSRCAYAEVEAGGEAFTIRHDYTNGCASTAGDYYLSLFGPRACAELRANRTLVVHNVDSELTPETGADMFNAIGIKAIICCPLVKNGELRAMMAVHQTTPRLWSASEISLVEEVVERSWAIIERARAELVLRKSEESRLMAVEAGGVGDWEFDPIKARVRWSDRARELMGFAVEDKPEKEDSYDRVLNSVHPDDRERFSNAVTHALNTTGNGQFRLEFRVVSPHGQVLWLDSRGKTHFGEVEGARRAIHLQGTIVDITERKRAEEERERFLSVGSELMVIASFDNQFKWVSPAWQRALGWSTEEFTAHPWLHYAHPDDQKAALEEMKRLPEGEKTISFENRYRTPDGSYRWLSWKLQPYISEQLFYATATDITERKRDAEALLERARLAELNADIGIALTQSESMSEMLRRCAETMVKHLDAAFARIWTLNQESDILELQASAGLYTHLNGPHSRVPVGQFKIGLIAQERRAHLTNEVVGDPRVSDQEWAKCEGMVAFAGYPLLVEDQIIGVMALFARQALSEATIQAMTSVAHSIALGIERKSGEYERARLLESEQQARQEAEATNRIKDEFLATLSHELRTPLNAILGWAHMLRAEQLDDIDTARALETIERNARAQVQLIEDLLDVSRIITGKLRLDVRPLELAEVIQAAIDTVRPAAEAKNIRLQMLIDPQAGPVSGDSDRLQQVVWNLLTNAVKFTPKGGRVQIRLERVNSHIEMAVSDTGQGIEADFLPHIFDRFRQADQTSTRAYGGLGLGLSIVHHLVELHGGTIHVESAGEGQGATFAVHLPRIAVLHDWKNSERRHPTAGRTDAADSNAYDCPPQLENLRVLIVDDEADTRDLLRAVLERCNCEVVVAASAAEALQIFAEWRPHVLVSDIGMPHEDGYALIGKVRAWEKQHGGRVPAIALTAYARVEDRVHALQAGFQVHVPKPIEPIELLAVVASLAGRTGVPS